VKVVRYAPALRRLWELSAGASVLDVGSGSSGVGTWLERPFVGVDLSFDTAPVPQMRAVVGDARQLPFPDATFDLVVCVDVLQELPPGGIEAVCGELARLAAGTVVVVAACGAEAEASDRRLLEWCARRHVAPPDWLPRQVRQGLPSPEAIRSALARRGRVTEGWNRSVSWHERMVRAELRPGLAPVRAAARPFLRLWGRLAPRDLPGGGKDQYGRWFVLEVEPARSPP
jgi:SAM-dependent methyltransferase